MTYTTNGIRAQMYDTEQEIASIRASIAEHPVLVTKLELLEQIRDHIADSTSYSDAEIKTHAQAVQALAIPEFKAFPSINRLQGDVTMRILEKIDGQNAQIYIPDDSSQPLFAGKRTCWIEPGKQDINGFAAWVRANEEALRRLGPGRHFGEWWGEKIQRNYGVTGHRFSLFNHWRFPGGLPDGLPPEVRLVPVLYQGEVSQAKMREVIADLFTTGSRAEPGWMKPEGVVIHIGAQTWKFTDRENKPKWMNSGRENCSEES